MSVPPRFGPSIQFLISKGNLRASHIRFRIRFYLHIFLIQSVLRDDYFLLTPKHFIVWIPKYTKQFFFIGFGEQVFLHINISLFAGKGLFLVSIAIIIARDFLLTPLQDISFFSWGWRGLLGWSIVCPSRHQRVSSVVFFILSNFNYHAWQGWTQFGLCI